MAFDYPEYHGSRFVRFGTVLASILIIFTIIAGVTHADELTIEAIDNDGIYSQGTDPTTYVTTRDLAGEGTSAQSGIIGYFDIGASKRVYNLAYSFPIATDLSGATIDSAFIALDGLGDYGDGNATGDDNVSLVVYSSYQGAVVEASDIHLFDGYVAENPYNGVKLNDNRWVDGGTANGYDGYAVSGDWNFLYFVAAGLDTIKAHDDTLRVRIVCSLDSALAEGTTASPTLTFSGTTVDTKEPYLKIYYTPGAGAPPAAPASIDTSAVRYNEADCLLGDNDATADSILIYDDSVWLQSFDASVWEDFTVTGLTPETEYILSATYKNDDGESDPCAALTFTTPAAPVTNKVYVRADAAGTNDGSDWTNAYTTLSLGETNVARGETLFVADGAYSESVIFNVAASGSDSIFVVKATVANHGTEDGWDNAYGDGQAAFTSSIGWVWLVTSSCWVFDGVSKTTDMTGHGFTLTNENTNPTPPTGTATGLNINSGGGDVEGIRAQYIAVYGPGETYVDNYNDGFVAYGLSGSLAGVYIGNCYSWGFREADLKASGVSDLIYEYNTGNIDSTRTIGVATHGGGTIINDGLENANITLRYNTLIYPCGTSCIEILTNGSGQDYIGGIYIYGNKIINGYSSNGVIGLGSQANTLANGWYVYNNTMYGNLTIAGQLIFFGGAGTFSADYVDCYAYNNLFAGTTKDSGTWLINGNGHNYNAAYVDIPNETNNVILNADVFADSSAWDLHLTVPVAGDSIASVTTNNLDMDAALRGGDGVWDIGAYEFDAEGDTTTGVFIDQGGLLTLTVGDVDTLTAAVYDAGVLNEAPTLVWSIDDPAIATIVEATGILTALYDGTATITVTASDIDDSTNTLVLTVNHAATTAMTPADTTLVNGGTVQFTVVATDSSGAAISSPTLTYSLSDSLIGSITSGGLLTALKAGTDSVFVTVTENAISDTSIVTILTRSIEAWATTLKAWGTYPW